MEKLYLPPKVGNTLATITMALAGVALIQAVDTYGESQYLKGKRDLLEERAESEAADTLTRHADQLEQSALATASIAAGFISISALSIHWVSNGRDERA